MTDALFRAQHALQAEADGVVADLGLDEHLRRLGAPVRTGSSALGLMVKPDIDITVVADRLDPAAVADLGRTLSGHPRVRQVTVRDDTGPWNAEPDQYPDGLYLQVRYRRTEVEWNLDIWVITEPDRMPDLAHVRELPGRLTDETRAAILQIKQHWADSPGYGRTVHGADVYTAVLDHGIRTPAQFDEWLIERAR